MLKFSKSALIKKQTHPHLGWPEFSVFQFWVQNKSQNYYQMQTFLEMNDSNVNNVNNFLFSILDIT